MEPLTLWQFRRSPYNEKARWALAHAKLSYERRSLLPGPHVFSLRATKQTKTPTLQIGNEFVFGSSVIARRVAPSLVPKDVAACVRIEQRFDEDWTPRVRRFVLDALLRNRDAWIETFAGDADRSTQLWYRRSLFFVAPVVRFANGIRSDASVVDGVRALEDAMTFVAEGVRETGFLVGSSFSLADVTAAAALSAVFGADHPDASFGPHATATMTPLLRKWDGHPALLWLAKIYRDHR